MRSMMKAALLALVMCSLASATILTFQLTIPFGLPGAGGPVPNGTAIPQAYGDRVTTASVAGNPDMAYLMGNAWTPHIVTDYYVVSQASGGPVAGESLKFQMGGFGDLGNVGRQSQGSGYYARIVLSADSGYAVRLNSFDLAASGGADIRNNVRVITGGGPLVVNPLISGTSHLAATPATFGQTSLTGGVIFIDFAFDSPNIAIDNISFDEFLAPEPSYMFLSGAGLLALAVLRRRK